MIVMNSKNTCVFLLAEYVPDVCFNMSARVDTLLNYFQLQNKFSYMWWILLYSRRVLYSIKTY